MSAESSSWTFDLSSRYVWVKVFANEAPPAARIGAQAIISCWQVVCPPGGSGNMPGSSLMTYANGIFATPKHPFRYSTRLQDSYQDTLGPVPPGLITKGLPLCVARFYGLSNHRQSPLVISWQAAVAVFMYLLDHSLQIQNVS